MIKWENAIFKKEEKVKNVLIECMIKMVKEGDKKR